MRNILLFVFLGIYFFCFSDNSSDKSKISTIPSVETIITNIYDLDFHKITIRNQEKHNIVPFGGLDLIINSSSNFESQGINFGVLYVNNDLVKDKLKLILINSLSNLFGINNYVNFIFYPLTNKNLEIGNSLNIFFSSPNYFIYSDYSNNKNYIAKIFNRLSMDFNDTNKLGFIYNLNINYTLPYKIKSRSFFTINYYYIFDKVIDNSVYPSIIDNINYSNLSIGLKEILTLDTRKEDAPYNAGNLLNLEITGDFPILNKQTNYIPDFTIAISDSYQKNLYKYITYRFRGIFGYNFNSNENLSGYNYARGVSNGAFNGFLYFFTNNELLLPIFNVDLYKIADIDLKSKMDWSVFFAIFVDSGVSLSNINKTIRNYDLDFKSDYISKNKIFLSSDVYFNYVLTVGGGIRFHPHHKNFIVRLDIGVNLLEAVIEEKTPSVEIILSFNDIL